ncbi:MAG TPA: type II toxin-antitoxin system HicA family toxin [Thermoanaerobaculia bacterium]
MGKHAKLLIKIVSAEADAGIPFADLRQLLLRLGFSERIRGSHHIFKRVDIPERLNLQRQGRHAKRYQVRDIRDIINRYGLDREI